MTNSKITVQAHSRELPVFSSALHRTQSDFNRFVQMDENVSFEISTFIILVQLASERLESSIFLLFIFFL